MERLGLKGFSLGLVLLMAYSCSTDVDLRADWKDITVVIGLLDQQEELHYIKINKTFLGTGNAYTYAQIRDSSEYDPALVDAIIEEKLNGNVVRTFQLRDTTLTNKEPGAFYAPEHTVYYFKADDLNHDAIYDLNIAIGSGADNLKFVTASTPLVKQFAITKPLASASQTIAFMLGTNYYNETIQWITANGGKRYELAIVLNYLEVTTSNDSIPRAIQWNLGTVKTLDTDGGISQEKSVNGENFYKWVSDKIKSTEGLHNSNVTHRIFRGLDFKITVAADELNTYMELNEPVTGIVQERPAYTNVTDGIGIFSARHSQTRNKKWLNQSSIEELYGGDYTSTLKFCSDSLGLWPNNDQDPSWCQ